MLGVRLLAVIAFVPFEFLWRRVCVLLLVYFQIRDGLVGLTAGRVRRAGFSRLHAQGWAMTTQAPVRQRSIQPAFR